MLLFNTAIDGLQMGLCYAILALGVYISYSLLDFPDLSVDGTFPLGGVVTTLLMLRVGLPPLVAVLLSFAAGFVMGGITGILHVKFKISNLLSGIIVMTALLSITLALTTLITDNGLTTTIFAYRSKGLSGIFNAAWMENFDPLTRDFVKLGLLAVLVIVVKLVIDLFFKTKLGYMIKATGNNPTLVETLGQDAGRYKMLGLALANGFSALSGAVYAHLFMQYDNTSGSGKVVLALASVIIGVAVFSKIRFVASTTAVILGALCYSLCLNFLVLVDTNGVYLKLLNAVLFALILIFSDKLNIFTKKRNREVPHD